MPLQTYVPFYMDYANYFQLANANHESRAVCEVLNSHANAMNDMGTFSKVGRQAETPLNG